MQSRGRKPGRIMSRLRMDLTFPEISILIICKIYHFLKWLYAMLQCWLRICSTVSSLSLQHHYDAETHGINEHNGQRQAWLKSVYWTECYGLQQFKSETVLVLPKHYRTISESGKPGLLLCLVKTQKKIAWFPFKQKYVSEDRLLRPSQ